jgi:hypothetical protein
MTTDTEALYRILQLEFPEDLGQVVPKIPPPRPAPRPVRHQPGDVHLFGRSLPKPVMRVSP